MSTPQNQVKVLAAEKLLAPIGTGVVIKQGDLFHVTSNLAVANTGAQDATIGMSDDTNPVASLGGDVNPNIGGAAGAISFVPIAPYKGCAVVYRILNNGESLAFWDAAYGTTDPQKCSSSSSSATQIGRCVELVSVTGDDVKRVAILLCGAN